MKTDDNEHSLSSYCVSGIRFCASHSYSHFYDKLMKYHFYAHFTDEESEV